MEDGRAAEEAVLRCFWKQSESLFLTRETGFLFLYSDCSGFIGGNDGTTLFGSKLICDNCNPYGYWEYVSVIIRIS